MKFSLGNPFKDAMFPVRDPDCKSPQILCLKSNAYSETINTDPRSQCDYPAGNTINERLSNPSREADLLPLCAHFFYLQGKMAQLWQQSLP